MLSPLRVVRSVFGSTVANALAGAIVTRRPAARVRVASRATMERRWERMTHAPSRGDGPPASSAGSPSASTTMTLPLSVHASGHASAIRCQRAPWTVPYAGVAAYLEALQEPDDRIDIVRAVWSRSASRTSALTPALTARLPWPVRAPSRPFLSTHFVLSGLVAPRVRDLL